MYFQVLESIFENEYVFEPTVIPLLFAFMGKLLKYCDDIKAPDIVKPTGFFTKIQVLSSSLTKMKEGSISISNLLLLFMLYSYMILGIAGS